MARSIREPIEHESLRPDSRTALLFTRTVTETVMEIMNGCEDETELRVWAFQTAGSAALIMNNVARSAAGTVNHYQEELSDGEHW
jgi:hypothetical protein